MISEKARELYNIHDGNTVEHARHYTTEDYLKYLESEKSLLSYIEQLEKENEEMLKMLIDILECHKYSTLRVTSESVEKLIEKIRCKKTREAKQ